MIHLLGIPSAFVPVGILALVMGCAKSPGRAMAGEERGNGGGAGALGTAELMAYGSGHEREAALARAALAALRRARGEEERAILIAGADTLRTLLEGARAAGVRAPRYRRIVSAVDSLLLSREGGRARSPVRSNPRLTPQAESLASWILPRLDSLRIELLVLRSRLAAETSRRCGAGRPQLAERPC